jgi:hypothetical protein
MSAAARRVLVGGPGNSSTMNIAYLTTGGAGERKFVTGAVGWSAKVYEFQRPIRHAEAVGSGGRVAKEYPAYLLAVFAAALGLFVMAGTLGASGWLAEDDRLTYAAIGCFTVGALAFLYSTRKAKQTGSGTALFVQGDQEAT